MRERPPIKPDDLDEALEFGVERCTGTDELVVALLMAWNAGFATAIADIIHTVTCRAELTATVAGDGAAARTAWLAQARPQPRSFGGLDEMFSVPRIMPALLATLLDAGVVEAAVRAPLLVDAELGDPRVDRALAAMLAAPSVRSEASLPFWRAMFDAAAEIRDRRAYDAICAAVVDPDGEPHVRRAFDQGFVRLRDTLAPVFAEPPVRLTAEQLERVAAIDGKLRRCRLIADLLDAVFANPDDDLPRLVYADALLEHGDPCGELIHLMIERHRRGDPQPGPRELELDDHREKLFGPLDDVIDDAVIERGFVLRASLWRTRAELIDSPWWSTVRHVDRGDADLLCSPALRGLTSAEVDGVTAVALAERGHAGLRSLACRIDAEPAQPFDALAVARGLPALVELEVHFDERRAPVPATYRVLLEGAVMARLARLQLHAPQGERLLAAWLAAIRAIRVPRVELVDRFERFGFEHTAGGYRLRDVRCDQADAERLATTLASLTRDDFADEIVLRLADPATDPTAALRALERFASVRLA